MKGELPVAAVSDHEGKIAWFFTKELQVIEVDGVSLDTIFDRLERTSHQVITTDQLEQAQFDMCPVCGQFV